MEIGMMKIKPYIDKLKSSAEFKKFSQKYKDAFLIAGFFVIDFETGVNMHQIDYYVPNTRKVAAFTLDDKIIMQMLKTISNKTPEKLDSETNIDLDSLRGILEEEMKNRSITEDIRKMIVVLQTVNGKKVWNVNCVLSGMDILKAHVEDESKTVLKMEKSSILNYLKKIPGAASQNTKQQPASKKELEEQIQQLDKLKSELKKQESELDKSKNQSED